MLFQTYWLANKILIASTDENDVMTVVCEQYTNMVIDNDLLGLTAARYMTNIIPDVSE